MNCRPPTLPVTVPLALAVAAWVAVIFGGGSTFRERFDQLRPGMTRQQVYDWVGPSSPMTEDAFGWETRAVVLWVESGNVVRRELGPPWKIHWLRPKPPCECWVRGGHVGWVGYDSAGLATETVWYDRSRPVTAWLRDRLRAFF
jgi:hypothetical protein